VRPYLESLERLFLSGMTTLDFDAEWDRIKIVEALLDAARPGLHGGVRPARPWSG
jgi:hypothetical protein